MGSGELRYQIGQTAYIKLILHALNHRATAVNAVLVGKFSGADDSNPLVEITDSVPLFHSQIGLLPPLEIALIQIEEYYGAQGLSIVGYFHANERFDDTELCNVAKNIGDHIHKYFPQAALLLLDNKKLEALGNGKERSPALQLYSRETSKSWKLSEGSSSFTIKEPSANAVLLDYIASKKWQGIVDFDDHLDDISKDWLNQGLFD